MINDSLQLSAPIVGVWQHEGGWLKEVLLSPHDLETDVASFRDHAPQLMLIHYDSQYYLQSLASPCGLQIHHGVGKVPKLTAESCSVDLGDEMRKVG